MEVGYFLVISIGLSVTIYFALKWFGHLEKLQPRVMVVIFGATCAVFLMIGIVVGAIEELGLQQTNKDLTYFFGDDDQYDMDESYFGGHDAGGLSVSVIKPNDIKTRLSDIAGMNEAKKEVSEIIDFLKSPEVFARLGAKPPKGVLMYGPPGTGKTFMARAIAGEAGVPFISVSGSAFDDKYVGTGAARVRALFEIARKNKPCIVFIDEMDALAGSRDRSGETGNDQTVNQLLSEIDNVDSEKSAGIIFLGATNRLESIDEAVLRPGRFDRKVFFRLPNLPERKEILAVLLKNIVYDKSLDLGVIAQITTGFSGADLANLINEAAIDATRKGKPHVDMASFEEANDKIVLGANLGSGNFTAKEREMIAYHEAGHALIGLLHPDHPNIFHKMTIGLRGSSLGATHFRMEAEKYSSTKREFEASIASSLGGLAAEEVVYGKDDVTTGASSDLQVANQIAKDMVTRYGMSDEGSIVVDDVISQGNDFVLRNATKILNRNYELAQKMISQNRDKLNLLVKTLLERETLDYEDIVKLIGPLPKRNQP